MSPEAYLEDQLTRPGASFSIGVPGAIAEFIRAGGEAGLERRGATRILTTAGGALRVALVPGVTPVVVKTPRRGGGWRHQVAFCLGREAAALGARRVLTELGRDRDAVDPQGRDEIRFDLGLSLPHIDACVRTGERDLIDLLRRFCGEALLEKGRAACEAIVARSPPRVFCSRLGRIEVTAPIPKDRSPVGPHTHLLPHLLGQAAPADAFIPRGLASCLDIYPENPGKAPALTLSDPGP